jgi:histidinol-phosphate aminotransferase
MSRFERPNIAAMQGYAWGEQPQDKQTIKLNTNENPYPPSPRVEQALRNIDISQLRTYPQPTGDTLRDAIAQHHGLSRDNVVLTNGGDEALRLALTTFVEPGAGFGMAEPSYSLYPVLSDIHDARCVRIALDQDWQMPPDFAAQINAENVQLTSIVNPHAPSGVLYDVATLTAVAATLNGILLVDEAYANFIDPQLSYDSTSLIEKHDNVLVLRTFSKGYSLAGLRLGYLLGSIDLIRPIIEKTRDSYNIDHLSQQLGLAAFKDQEYAARTWQHVREQRTLLRNTLGQLGLTSPASQSNFLLVEVPKDARLNAAEIYATLKQAGVLVRYFNMPRLTDKLRITIGTPQQNEHLIELLTNTLQSS